MKEGTRYRHRITDTIAEVVHNFHMHLSMVSLVNGNLFTLDRKELIEDWIRLDTD